MPRLFIGITQPPTRATPRVSTASLTCTIAAKACRGILSRRSVGRAKPPGKETRELRTTWATRIAGARGVPQNYANAAYWYRKAAEQGDQVSQFYLGWAYSRGQGVPRNYVEAARWYLKVLGPIALHCARRLGWAPHVAVLLSILVLVVPDRRWGRARWAAWAVYATALALMSVRELTGTFWSGSARIVVIAVFGAGSAICALVAVTGAVRDRKRGVGPLNPPTTLDGNTSSSA
jgi:hypothetical protein